MSAKRMRISLANGGSFEVPEGTTLRDFLAAHAKGFGPHVLAARVDGKLRGLYEPVPDGAVVEPVEFRHPDGEELFRHSAAHIMASAVKELFPQAQLAIGPPIENGFYYDFGVDRPFTPEDLARIEARMGEIVERDAPFRKSMMERRAAIDYFRGKGEGLKVELLETIPDDQVSIYSHGDYVDLCRGPHLPSTGYLRSFKVLHAAGAYWRGDERNAMLQRIYGTAFPDRKELEAYLHRVEEAKKRDHRVLGQKLDLFSIQEAAGVGLVFWHPKGAAIRRSIEEYWVREHERRGYRLVVSPHIARAELWQTSGHLGFYKDKMFPMMELEKQNFILKPMNCPFHIQIYQDRKRSYRELPIRIGELGTVYRLERRSELHGMLRVRGFTQDDAHIFCTPEQALAEVKDTILFARDMLGTLGFDRYQVDLSLHDPAKPEEYAGDEQDWAHAEGVLATALEEIGMPYRRVPGEAAFYGPKVDILLIDALERKWQCSTIQFDFNLPQRFDVAYTGSDGADHRVIMVHRALLGSVERFVGTLIEHTGGEFPLWLAPVHVVVLTLSEELVPYAREVETALREAGIRVESDYRDEKLGAKIREAEMHKAPYMAIIGRKERDAGSVGVRARGKGDLGPMPARDFTQKLLEEIKGKH